MQYRQSSNESPRLEHIPDYHRSYDPLQYPLVYPCGQDGWHLDCKHTCLEHINFQIMDRVDDKEEKITNPILLGRTLNQQYQVG